MSARLLLKLGATLLLLLLLLLGAAVFFRKPLAAWLVESYLERRGLAASLTVEEVTHEGAELRALRLGDLSLDHLKLHWDLWPADEARLERVTARGLRLPLDLTASDLPLAEVRSLLPTGGEPGGRGDLPEVEIESAEIALDTAAGPALLTGAARFLPGEERLELSVSGGAPLFSLQGEATAELAEGELRALRAEGGLAAPDRGLAGKFAFYLKKMQDSYAAELEVSVAAAEAAYALLAGPAVPRAGALGLEGAVTAEGLAPDLPLGGGPEDWWTWLAEGTLQAAAALDMKDLAWPQAEGVSGRLAVVATAAAGMGEVALSDPAALRAERLSPDALRHLGLPEVLARHLASGGTLEVQPYRDEPLLRLRGGAAGTSVPEIALSARAEPLAGGSLSLDVQARAGAGLAEGLLPLQAGELVIAARDLPLPGGTLEDLRLEGEGRATLEELSAALEGQLVASLEAPPLPAERLVLQGSLLLEAGGEGLRLATAEPGVRLSATGLVLPAGLRFEKLDGALTALDLRLAETTRLAATLVLSEATVKQPQGIRISGLSARLDGELAGDALDLKLEVAEGSVALADRGYALEKLSGRAAFDGKGLLRAEVSGATLVDRRPPVTFVPLRIAGQAERREPSQIAFSVTGRGAGGAARLKVAGTHDLLVGRGQASLELAPVTFALDGLQPEALLPLLPDLEKVSGGLTGSLRGSWNDKGFRGSGRLTLQDAGFSYSGLTVSGLDLDLQLDRLLPLRSPPGQRLTADSLVAGVTLSDLAAEFQILADEKGSPLLQISGASAEFLDGRLRLAETGLATGSNVQSFTLEAEGLDMRKLTKLLQLEELSASGQLSGTIPVRISGGALVIEQGHLAATGEGVISFTSEEAKAALASGGETVALMMEALEDFRYEELEIDLSKPARGETEVKLSLLGSNPEVLEGHPFRININLSTDAEPLLRAYIEGTRLSEKVLRELWRLRQ